MSERVSMPALGESVTEGTVTRWLKSVGDEVEVDEPLLEVSTDKVDTEIPSPVAGVLQEILAEEDETVEVGADLAVIGDGSDTDSSDASESDEGESDEGSGEAEEDDSSESNEADSADQESDDEPAAEATSSKDSDDASQGSGDGERVTMPALGESVTEGTVTRWLKEEGDDVEVDEPLLEVSTDKVDTEIPSPVAGKLTKIMAAEDETVEVGGDLAIIGGSSGGDSEASSDEDENSEEEDLASEQRVQEEAGKEAESASDDSKDAESASGDSKDAESASDDSKDAESASDDSKDADSSSADSGSKDVSAYVTPLVRKLAAKHSVDLDSIEGTGVGGRIRKQDVLDAAKASESAKEAAAREAAEPESEPEAAPAAQKAPSSPSPAPAKSTAAAPSEAATAKRGTTEKMSRLRKVIATRMVESLQVSAQLTTVVEVDVTKVAKLRTGAKDAFLKREGVKLSFMPFFALAAVDALKAHPVVNSSIDGDEVVFHSAENLGIAVDTPKGLIVPVIKDAGDLNVAGLARKIADLAERTRTNKIGPDELGGGTFTLTNTGSRGALFDTPILNQPQVGILGTGSVVRRPVVMVDEDGGETIAIRSMVYLALTYDHRIVDGADAARFLTTVKARLEEASFEV